MKLKLTITIITLYNRYWRLISSCLFSTVKHRGNRIARPWKLNTLCLFSNV